MIIIMMWITSVVLPPIAVVLVMLDELACSGALTIPCYLILSIRGLESIVKNEGMAVIVSILPIVCVSGRELSYQD